MEKKMETTIEGLGFDFLLSFEKCFALYGRIPKGGHECSSPNTIFLVISTPAVGRPVVANYWRLGDISENCFGYSLVLISSIGTPESRNACLFWSSL